MNVNSYISALVQYGLDKELFEPCDKAFIINQLISSLQLSSYEPVEPSKLALEVILQGLLENAVERGIIGEDITSRDLLDTKLMGVLTPPPREVRAKFASLYMQDARKATDWFYQFSQDTDYIRRYRIQKDIRWKTATEYGNLDITINLSKPEKDPKAIAAAKAAPQSGYPKCQLCAENEGYAGRINHPARQNHRIIPVTIAGADWYLQYSPYVYYNEHCIAFNAEHTPMKIDKAAFEKLLDFVTIFPHYFVGSNADLPIVGGSILSHEHFQGGNYTFAMAKAEVETEFSLTDYPNVTAGIVKWPMSVIRLKSKNREELSTACSYVLEKWRGYSDPDAGIFAFTDDVPHNTVTPIARMNGEYYECDLVLRNNITSDERPLGVFHPNQSLHHIKKENIGLIEVMGLAVLPARLAVELEEVKKAMLAGADLNSNPATASYSQWAKDILLRYPEFSETNAEDILHLEVGKVFEQVICDAGVFKRDEKGIAHFKRFVEVL